MRASASQEYLLLTLFGLNYEIRLAKFPPSSYRESAYLTLRKKKKKMWSKGKVKYLSAFRSKRAWKRVQTAAERRKSDKLGVRPENEKKEEGEGEAIFTAPVCAAS